MQGLLRDFPSTVVYIDDILITAESEEEHLNNINTVMPRLTEAGLTLKKSKCHFLLERVEYLGHTALSLRKAYNQLMTKSELSGVPQNVT